MFEIQILNAYGTIVKSAKGSSEVRLYYPPRYAKGDRILFSCDAKHVAISVDQALPESLVYLSEGQMAYPIPFDQEASAYPSQAFFGEHHLLSIRPARAEELAMRRNLALNPLDIRYAATCYPHVEANVETRDEPIFFARNAINGLKFPEGHGQFPYLSWGIGGRDDAEMTLHFGRPVEIDETAFTLRADFPHDSYWTEGLLTFSDGEAMTLSFGKTGETQSFSTGRHTVEWLRLSRLIKADDASAFPALTQWEVFGRDIL